MRSNGLFGLCMSLAFVISTASTALGQTPEPEPQTRQTTIESAAAEKATDLYPYEVTTAEKVFTKIENRFNNQTVRWHPSRGMITPTATTPWGFDKSTTR